MPSANKVLQEIQGEHNKNPEQDPFFSIRRKYLENHHKIRGRNVIAYYSGWLQQHSIGGSEINDNDKNSFMSVIHGLDRSKGLDLILHTPGGGVAETESLVDYLKQMFNSDFEVFVPQLAMSAGTMIACASKQIHMGKQSSLGPIDPQFNGLPASAILEEFERAAREIKKQPEKLPLWQVIINKYHPSLILSCENAIAWSKEIVEEWLKNNMFKDNKDKEKISKNIVNILSDHQEMKTHSRHISLREAQKIGLKISQLEDNQELQDTVLAIHHAYMHTLSSLPIIKIIENHNSVGQILQFAVKPDASHSNR